MTRAGVSPRPGTQLKDTGGIRIVLAVFAPPAPGARRAIGFAVKIREPYGMQLRAKMPASGNPGSPCRRQEPIPGPGPASAARYGREQLRCYGSSSNASAWRGRTTVKWRRLSVAILTAPCRSARAMTDASVPPSRKSA
jgi:hypothetical protein